jgi:hypothetical protein
MTLSFVMSVCLFVLMSVRLEQLGSHWTDFDILAFPEKNLSITFRKGRRQCGGCALNAG